MIKLSIIIPIYKVEKYIVECIESICCQLVEGVEVILVNDGTPDRSMEMAKDYISNKYCHYLSRFVFIDQENQGQSAARNKALAIAQGCYVGFVDSDDILCANYFQVLLKAMKTEAHIIRFGAFSFFENKEDCKEFVIKIDESLNNNQILKNIFNQCAWFPWLNIYKKEIILFEEFPNGMYFEDAWLISKLILKAKNIIVIRDNIYLYRLNLTSSLNDKSIDNIKKLNGSYVKIIEEYDSRLKQNSLYSKSYIAILMSYIGFLVSNQWFNKAYIMSKRRKHVNLNPNELNRSTKMFYKFGIIFVVIYKLLGRL